VIQMYYERLANYLVLPVSNLAESLVDIAFPQIAS